ncbi:MAG TPA: SIMPL domain-containing protein [Candidatus Saccharimonadales bacterium]|nr:SIMPL domain-containing protein [Candidatus Saccharimonadales bacterium]
MAPVGSSKTKLTVSFALDYRIISVVLLLLIIAMLFLWRPWAGAGATARTVDVTGDATISAKPDEFSFYPTYEVKNDDKKAALAELSAKSDEILAKLKQLGVPDNKIKTSTSGYDYPVYYDSEKGTPTYTLQLTVTVDSNDVAQKVQDYLVTTAPTGDVSPQATFSEATRKKLEALARDAATKDARAKANQMARNLGFKVGRVKAVQDGSGFGNPIPMVSRGSSTMMAEDNKTSLDVRPGENDLSYTVSVTYYIR